jgi:phospholipase/carboxylesterase
MSDSEPQLIDQGPILDELGLVHKVLEPRGAGPYRTVVMLHGRYGSEDVMWIFEKSTPVNWLKIAPRGIVAEAQGGFSWLHQEYGVWPELPAFDPAVAAVTRFLQGLPRVYNADPERIYLMGFSQGAAVSYATVMRHPGLVQAVAGLVGFVPGACAANQDMSGLEDLPVFMAVGRRDPLVPRDQALGCAETLRDSSANLLYKEYDTGHKLNAQGMRDLQHWWHQL